MFRTRRRHLRAILRDAPDDTGTPNPGGGGSAPTPAPTPAPPANPADDAFDPSTLPPAARKYYEAKIKEADEKARTGTRDNAAKAAEAKIKADLAKALGLTPDEVDPKALSEELAQARKRNAELLAESAIGKACRKPEISADEDLVAAYLAKAGKLDGLDPSDKGYAAAVEKLVTEAVAAKPALKLASTAPTPPGGQQLPASATFNRPAGGENGTPQGLHAALGDLYAKQR